MQQIRQIKQIKQIQHMKHLFAFWFSACGCHLPFASSTMVHQRSSWGSRNLPSTNRNKQAKLTNQPIRGRKIVWGSRKQSIELCGCCRGCWWQHVLNEQDIFHGCQGLHLCFQKLQDFRELMQLKLIMSLWSRPNHSLQHRPELGRGGRSNRERKARADKMDKHAESEERECMRAEALNLRSSHSTIKNKMVS